MINMNDVMGAVTGSNDNDSEDNKLSGLMDMAKDFDMAELERFKSMSKSELLQEVKNSEHSAKVIEFLKGLIAQKGE